MSIEDQARAAVANAPTTGAHAAPAPPQQPAPRRTFAAEGHHIMSTAWHAIGRYLPFMEEAALNKQTDEGIELLMTAAGLGAQARDLELVLVQLRHIVATLQAEQAAPQSSFQPAPDVPQDM